MLLVIALFAQIVTTLSQDGAKAMREQRFADAEKVYRELVKREPANPLWHMNLGLALHSAGRYAEALPEFTTFLKAKPAPGPIHLVAALAQLKLNKPCEAVPLLEKARQWNAEKTLVELGDAYAGCGQREPAAQAYEAALSTPAKSKEIARHAAHNYWLARSYGKARPLFASVASDYARDPDFLYEYGDTLVREQGPEAGIPPLLKAYEYAPDRLPARAELGKALLAVDRAAEAIPHLEAAAPQDSTLLLPLSRAYKAVGRTADAAKAQEEYRKKVGAQ
ncbi:MAG TPA: tetratricopeptide repeat protein [Bryobacteraceae bacterium]|nr:tetratricopeptide repeat protein [Bryobacteraceae bacterium]